MIRRLLLCGLTCLGAAACVGSVSPPDTASSTARQDYVIGPGDRLDVFVYDQPQLSETGLPVRPDGRISTPLAADVQAAGRTPSQLSSALSDRLSEFVKTPKVTIIVRDFVGAANQQVRVIGAASAPLSLPYRSGMTVLDVMIATKGLTRFAAGNNGVIIRHEAPGVPDKRIGVRLADLLKDGDLSQNVSLQPGDIIVIPQSWF